MQPKIITKYHETLPNYLHLYKEAANAAAATIGAVFNSEEFQLTTTLENINEFTFVSSFIALYLQSTLELGTGNPLPFVLTKHMLPYIDIIKITNGVFDVSSLFTTKS